MSFNCFVPNYNCIVKRTTKTLPLPGGPLFHIDSTTVKHTNQLILYCWGAVGQQEIWETVGLQALTTKLLHMSKMKKDPADNPQPSNSSSEKMPYGQPCEVLLQNGSLSHRKSDENMDGHLIHKPVREKLYFRVLYNKKRAIDDILYYAKNIYEIIQQNNYYLPDKENKILLELLTIAETNSRKYITLKQRGYMWLKRKDGMYEQYGPYFGDNKKHSEDFIIEKLLKIFNNFDDSSPTFSKHTDYTELWIYSTYCPCLAKNNRELRHHNPCMMDLYFLMKKLKNTYNITTNIGFSEFYGLAGSFLKNLPYHPLNQNNFPMYQIKKRIKSDDCSCKLIKVYNTFVQELENEAFKMEKYLYKKSDLAKTFTNLLKPIPGRFRQKIFEEQKELFQHPGLMCGFNEFYYLGWEKITDTKEKITNTKEKLITMFGNDLSDEVWKVYLMALEDIFLEWWDKKVNEASSIFINKNVSDYLKMCTFQLFLNDIPDTVNKNFIGLLNHTNDPTPPVIKSENVILMDWCVCMLQHV
nr:uncharacterized protein LOC129444701 [Misgurnus anguillicaudatus]